MKHLIALILLSCQVFALSLPQNSKFDQRVAYAVYNADDVFLIKAKDGYVSVLQFANDERIINIATGFSAGWDLIDRENMVFVRPKAYQIQNNNNGGNGGNGGVVYDEEGVPIQAIKPTANEWKTNMIVSTNKRIYVFDLILIEQDKSEKVDKPTYKLSFNYPMDEKAKIEAENNATKAQNDKKEIEKKLERTSIPRNWEFFMKVNQGSEDIAPNFAYDDGVFTYLGFDTTKTFPSVFMSENDNESILNTHVKKDGKYDVLVVHKVTKQILLRSGSKLVGILNAGYGKNPIPETRQTSSDQVEREVIKNESR